MMLHFKIRLTALAIGILSLAANAQTSIGPLRHWQASIEASTYNTLDWGVELGILNWVSITVQSNMWV